MGLSKLGLQLSRPNKYTPASLTKWRIAYFHIKLHSRFDQLWLICFIQPSEWKKVQHSVRYLLIGWHSYQPHFNQKKINRHAHTHSIDVNIVWEWTHRNLLLFSFSPLEFKFKANILRPPNDERRVKRLRSGRKFLDGETKTNEYLYRGVNSKNWPLVPAVSVCTSVVCFRINENNEMKWNELNNEMVRTRS